MRNHFAIQGNYKLLMITLFFVFLFSDCGPDEHSEIVDRWDNGAKKTVATYRGRDENEQLIKEERYTSSGTLFKVIKHPEKDTTFYYELHHVKDTSFVGRWGLVKMIKDSSGIEKNLTPQNKTLSVDPDGSFEQITVLADRKTVRKGYLIATGQKYLFTRKYSLTGTKNDYTATSNLKLNDKGKIMLLTKLLRNNKIESRDTTLFKIEKFTSIYIKDDTLVEADEGDSITTSSFFISK